MALFTDLLFSLLLDKQPGLLVTVLLISLVVSLHGVSVILRQLFKAGVFCSSCSEELLLVTASS